MMAIEGGEATTTLTTTGANLFRFFFQRQHNCTQRNCGALLLIVARANPVPAALCSSKMIGVVDSNLIG